jgi:hypothetical protein
MTSLVWMCRFVMSVALLLLCGVILLQTSYYGSGGGGVAAPAAGESPARSSASTSPPSPGQPCAPWSGNRATKSLRTPWGSSIEVREFGTPGCAGAIMIHGEGTWV